VERILKIAYGKKEISFSIICILNNEAKPEKIIQSFQVLCQWNFQAKG